MKHNYKFIAWLLCFIIITGIGVPANAKTINKEKVKYVTFGEKTAKIEVLKDNDNEKIVKVTMGEDIVTVTNDKNLKKITVDNNDDKKTYDISSDSTQQQINSNVSVTPYVVVDPGDGGGYTDLKIVESRYAFSDIVSMRYGYNKWVSASDSSVIYWNFEKADQNLYPWTRQTMSNSETCIETKNDITTLQQDRAVIAGTLGVGILLSMFSAASYAVAVAVLESQNLSPTQEASLYITIGNIFTLTDDIDNNLTELGYLI